VDPDDLAATLAEFALFADLGASALRAIAADAVVHEVPPDAVVLRADAVSEQFFLVCGGRIRVGDVDATAGAFFGEAGLLTNEPASVDAVAVEAATLVVLPRAAFLRVLDQHARVADRLATMLRARHREDAGNAAQLWAAIDALAARADATPVIELLPVFLREGGVWWAALPTATPLQASAQPDAQRDAIVDVLNRHGVRSVLFHSTSWRYEEDVLRLTYLAVIADPAGAPLRVQPARRQELARGGRTAEPTRVAVEQVLEHALRHLAWLLHDDADVARTLGDDWADALAAYEPEPFRALGS
jgi:CRP-like cAMP-binding protein